MTEDARQLRARLRAAGLSNAAIDAAWPRWWSEDAESSRAARAELRFGIARRLGIDPRSLFEDDEAAPRFMWRDEARFKHLSGESQQELAGITSFGHSVAAALTGALKQTSAPRQLGDALTLRSAILHGSRPYVELLDLLALCWGTAIPVAHLRIFPWRRKRMAAMSVSSPPTWAILLGKDSRYPAILAFYLAHELGHIALGHVQADHQIVDFDDLGPSTLDRDAEDRAADAYALLLLTGEERLEVLPQDPVHVSAVELARTAADSAHQLRIEPGTLALMFGYSTGIWPVATAALARIYSAGFPVWRQINEIALQQLASDSLPADTADFLYAVLGAARNA
ncbi:MAG: hypothetical protein KGK34_09550 [Chloroflexota bacterium]|nr:hypothetical protein [Chloroflexota bacterium]